MVTGTRTKRAGRVLLVVALLLVLAALLIPLIVNHTPRLQARIRTAVAQRLRGAIHFDRLRVSLIPLPHVQLAQVALSFPDSVEGTIEMVSAYPRLWPLFSGRFELSRLRLSGADVRIYLPRRHTGGRAHTTGNAVAEFRNAAAAVLAAATARTPGLALVVRRTTVSFNTGRETDVRLVHVRGRVALPPDRLRVDLSCASDLWERLSISAVLNPTTLEGSGHLDLTQLHVRTVVAPFLPAGIVVDDAALNLGLGIQLHGHDRIEADVDSSMPELTIGHDGKTAHLLRPHLRATWHLDGDTMRVTLPRLQLDSPHLQLAGSLVLGPDGVQLQAQTTELDVAALRPVAAMWSNEASILNDIFDVLRAGHVPHLAFHSAAPSLKDLGNANVLVIDGRLVDGRIHIPGIGLELGAVTGNVKIANATLFGDQVSARLDKSQATGATLRIGLSEPHKLAIDTRVDADAAELAALLRRLVKNVRFQREAKRFVDIAGTVSGTLRIGGNAQDVTVVADAQSFSVSGHLDGTQLPIHVQSGRFRYAEGTIDASDMLLKVGASTIAQAGLRFTPGGQGGLTAVAGRSHIALGEAYPWLLTAGWLPDAPWKPVSLAGTVSLASLTVRHTDASHRAWGIRATGAAHALQIDSPALHEHVPIRYPVSLTKLQLAYDTNTGTSFAAEGTAAQGVSGTVDLTWNAEGIDLKRLHLRDAQSDATITLRSTPTDLSVTFTGNLADATVTAISERDFWGGTLRGNFRAAIRLDHPPSSTLDGDLHAQGLTVPLLAGRHLRVVSASVNGAGRSATVDGTVDGDWGSPLQLRGTIRESPQALVADLSATAGRLDWSRIEPWLQRPTKQNGPSPPPTWEHWVHGNVRLSADSFTYGGFTWQSAQALVTTAPGGVDVTITNATVCDNITTPGTIRISRQGVTLAFQPSAQGAPFGTLTRCIGIKKEMTTGTYTLAAHITAHGQAADLARSLAGHAKLSAKNGRIYGMSITARVLSVLNVATGGYESLTDTIKEGLPYDTITASADLKGETVELREATLDGPSVKWVAQGSVNLATRTLDVTLLAAPLRRVDSVIGRIPLISGVLGGSLVTIPVKVSGTLDDPQITPLPPTAVGEGLLRVMKRTLKLPVTVLQPLLPGSGK